MDQDYEESQTVQTFSFLSEEFNTEIEEALSSESPRTELETLLNHINLKVYNKKNTNELFTFLNKFNKKDNFEKFLQILSLLREIKLQNNQTKLTITSAVVQIFKQSFEVKILIEILKLILGGTICDIKTLKDDFEGNIIEKIDIKLKNVQEFESKLISIFNENKNKFEYMLLFANLLKSKNLKESSKNTISQELINYFDYKILDDAEMEKNLAKGRHLVATLKYANHEDVYNKIIPSCESLLLRTMRNYKFLEMLLANLNINFKDEFISDIFDKFKDFFFSQDKLINESALNVVKALSKNSNRKLMINILLKTQFDADKVELNLHVCTYLVTILNESSNVKKCFSNVDLLKVVNYVLSKMDLLNENTKAKLEIIIELLIKDLYYNEIAEKEEIGSVSNEFNTLVKKYITSSSYSYFFGYLYMLIQIANEKFGVDVQKVVSDNLLNNIKDFNLTLSNIRNNLPLLSACFTLCANKEDLFSNNTVKKSMLDALRTILYSKDSTNVILQNNSFLNSSEFDSINIFNIFYQISKNKEGSLFDYFGAEELPPLAKTLGHLLFRNSKSKSEMAYFEAFVDQIKEKSSFDLIMDSIFQFVVHFFNSPYQHLMNRISFTKVNLLTQKYSDLFYQEFDDKDFLKFVIIAHIPNQFNDINIDSGKHIKFNNRFLNNIYKKYSTLQTNKDIFVQLEENYSALSQFIFSDLGIFNKNNKIIVNSCYNLLTRLMENLSHDKFAKNISSDAFIKLNYNKLKYVDEIIKFYTKQTDYISFYDLSYLVENLKQMEKTSSDSQIGQEFVVNVKLEKTEKKEEKVDNNNKNKKNQPAKGGKQNVQTTQKKEEKVDKETKLLELKSYFQNFLVNLQLDENFLIKRLEPIFDLFNLNDIIIDKTIHKTNLKNNINHLWKLLRVSTINTNLLNFIHTFLKKNKLSKNFSLEFSKLMYLQVNPKEVHSYLEQYPNLVINFNEKLEKIMLNPTERDNLFEYFDFIIIKLLFFVILNHQISNEDKISSVDILIKIIENLPESILNFNDISMLAVSLLRTSYNHENLSKLLEILLKKSKEENFLTLCEDLLNYEYVAKVSFLTQILNLNMVSLRKYKNLVYKIWILIFDENENISNLSKEIWNKFNLYLDSHFTTSDEFKLCFTDHKLKDSINRSVRAYSFVIKSQIKFILEKYEEYYEEEINRNLVEEDEEKKYYENDKHNLRTILFDYVDETIELFSDEMKQSLLDFLMRISDNESDEQIFFLMNKTIFNIIKSIKSETLIQNTLSSIEKNIKSIATKDVKEINYKNLKIILMMLSSILSSSKIKSNKSSLYDSIYALAYKLQNSEVLALISSCFSHLGKDEESKSSKLFDEILINFKSSKDKNVNLGEIYVLSGLIKCFGISTYKSKNLESAVLENMKKAKTIHEKQNSITLIKVFAETLKRLYEPYLVNIFDQICELITDREDKVREATQNAIKSFMKELSGFGVKSIMPRLIKDLHNMNWRSKVVNIEILGQFAFCAPKQLSIYIPKVIKEIMHVFKDPHEKVQETAVRVLKDISSVIKNPEIVELSSLLIDAISNPYENSKNALTALLETDFKHAIDPPSLALIIPIIDYNLKVQSENLKKMAAHVIGSIANLIGNPLDIYQYIDIIIPNLKVALFDSIPECRNAMAKAIGSLTKSLGSSYLQEMIGWVKGYLEIEVDTVQKSGASQAYAEMLVAFGEGFIDKHILHIISKIQESDYIAKEGYLSIFVFLPGCLGEKFEKYFELMFPLIIEAFSDEHENVRNVANKIFEICIKLFAKRNTKQLVDPLLLRLFDENWRIRNSSIALVKTLIMNLNKEFFKESSTYFTKEQRDEILVLTFILKADNSGNTATIANMIWRDYVDNIPKYLSRVLKQIYEQLMVLLSSDKDECFDIAEGCIKMLVTKFSDKFFMELLPAIKETITERSDNENNVYASFYIFQLACSEASEKLLSGYRERFIKIVNENVNTPFSSVRKLLASIIYELSRKFDDHNTNKTFIYNIMKNARGKQYEDQKNLLEIVGNLVDISKGEVLNLVINEIFRKPYEEGFLSLATMISADIAKNTTDATDITELYGHLTDALSHIPNATVDAIVSITTHLDEGLLPAFVDVISKLCDKMEHTSLTLFVKTLPMSISQILYKFADYTSQDLSQVNQKLVEININLLNFDYDNNPELVKSIGETIKLVMEKAEKEEIDKFLIGFMTKLEEMEHKLDLEGVDRVERISGKFKNMMDSLLFLVQNGLLYSEDKAIACDFINKLLEYTSRATMKSYIMKMIGPMIRILSEKYAPEIKERILNNIQALIMKSKEDIKGISPQLQSVFVKTLTDSSSVNSERCQLKAGENILRLLQYYPRPDVIVNDLMKSITQKSEKGEFLSTIVELEILSDIVKFYGNTLKPLILAENFARINAILNTRPEVPYDYLVSAMASFTKYKTDINECQKFVEETIIKEELPKKLFHFMSIFNGNLQFFQQNKKFGIKVIKSLPKDQSVILLKAVGKIINKYKYFIDLDKVNFEKLLTEFESLMESVLSETDLLIPSNNLIDGNLCIFIMSLGYLNSYETNESLFNKVFKFLLGLIAQGKVNSQLLVNCLSLIILKEIKPNVDKETIIGALETMNFDEKDVQVVETFLKKIYYLNN